MKRTTVRSLVKIPVSVAIFCTGISLLLSGCERAGCPFVAGTGPGCSATVSGPGIYLVTYQDSTGAERTREITVTGMSGEGTVCVSDCTTIIGDPVLIAPLPPDNLPPDCSQARASVPILPNDPARMVEESIEGVTDPDGNSIGIRIDGIDQDEPEAGLFEGDACPDSFTTSVSTARIRAERSANGSGRVYSIEFTASDRNGGYCTGSAKVCVPLTEGGTCFDNGSVFSECSNGLRTSDLSVTISDSPDPIAPGELLTYTIVVSTNGPSDASNILLTDTLPPGVTYFGAETDKATCSQSEGVVSCHITQVKTDGSETIEIRVRSITSGTYTNTVSVSALETDPNIHNNTATAITVASTSAVADLAVTISDSPDPVRVGEQVTYTATVTNNGPLTATGVRFTDSFGHEQLDVVSVTASQGVCETSSVLCDLGTIANGASATVTFVATAAPRDSLPGTIDVQAAVSADQPDPNPDNNHETETTSVLGVLADLSLSFSDAPDPVTVGDSLTYTTIVTNNGPSTASRVRLRVDLSPFVLQIESVSTTQGSCSEFLDNVDCELGSVASGSSVAVTIVAAVLYTTVVGTITSTASVASVEPDPNPANNTSSTTTVVNLPNIADLSVAMVDSPDPVTRGSAVTYTVTVTNNGPVVATSVVLTDFLPPVEITDSDIQVSQGSFTRQRHAGTITCNFGALASGASATLTVTGFTATTGTITNRASATAAEPDPNTANNSAAEDTTVTASDEETLLASWLYQGQFSSGCRPLADRRARFEVPLEIAGRPWLLSWLSRSQRN